MNLPAAADITALHDYALAAPGQPSRFKDGVWAAIEANHWHNCALWEQQELARRRDAPDSEIASNKRAIDAHDRKRNDAIEKIDEALLGFLDEVTRTRKARQHSETAGAMIDRLSVLSLRMKAMRGVDGSQLDSLSQQRADLAACLDRLLAEASRGETFFKLYRSKGGGKR